MHDRPEIYHNTQYADINKCIAQKNRVNDSSHQTLHVWNLKYSE